MSILSLKNISLRFGGLYALRDVSFEVQPGEIFSVIGPNGAGKTSLFNVITGLYSATEGEILLNGRTMRESCSLSILFRSLTVGLLAAIGLVLLINSQSLFQATIIDRYIYQQPFVWSAVVSDFLTQLRSASSADTILPGVLGFFCGFAGMLVTWRQSLGNPESVSLQGVSRTFQNIRLYNQLSVRDNVRVSLDTRSPATLLECAIRFPSFYRKRRESMVEAEEILRFVGLSEFIEALATNLSYGDKRRLEIARALATRPKVLLLDEPAAGMNPTEAASLMELIKSIRARGITVILIEHHMKVVMGISDRVVVLDYGNQIAAGTPKEICANPRVIEAYLGAGAAS